MRRPLCILVLVAGLCLLPFDAFAAAAEGTGWGWYETLGRWINLLLLFGLILFFVRIPIADFFQNRRGEIRRQLRAAEQARADAEDQLAQVRAKMANLEQELDRIRAEAEAAAELERKRILEESERDAEKLTAAARREIQGLTRGAQQSLKDYAARLSLEMAAQQIKKELDEKTEQKLIDRFIVQLSSDRGRQK